MIAVEKVTFNLPVELKGQVSKLKDKLHISMSAIYTEAIKEYIQKQERLRWERGFELASQDEEYMSLCEEMGSDDGGLYEYESK